MSTIINATTTNGVVIQPDNSGSLVLQTNNGTTALTIDTSQNVGIGTTSPTTKLQVNGGMTMATANWFSYGTDNTFYSDSSYGLVIKAPATSNFIAFRSSNDTERMRIDSSGNVGIGTSSPTNKLTVNGGIDFSGSAFSGSGTGIWQQATNVLGFVTAGSTRAVIDSSGRAGIAKSSGLTGQLNVSNGQGFSNGTGALTLAAVVVDGNYGGGLSFVDGTQGYSLWAQTSGADFYIRRATTTGAFTGGVFINNAATSWSAASDENVKDIIEPIENAIEKVLILRTVIGKYKDEEEGIRHPFLIAQDVEKVLPEAISVMNKGSENECLGLSYTDTIPLLVAAIKEQQTIINDLKARIETLEAK